MLMKVGKIRRKEPWCSCQSVNSYLGYEDQVSCSDLKISFSYAYSKRLTDVVITSRLKQHSLALPWLCAETQETLCARRGASGAGAAFISLC